MSDSPTTFRGRPARYGPFHRLASPTQTRADARRQVGSGELWGSRPLWGDWPKVQAYRGRLPDGSEGIEFYTDAQPDGDGGPTVGWSVGSRGGNATEDGEFAKITCTIVRVEYRNE